MKDETLYYKEKHSFRPLYIFMIILFGVIISITLGGVYGYLSTSINLIFYKFIFFIGTGIVIGQTIALSSKLRAIHSPKLAWILGVFFGLAAVYGSWAGWLYYHMKSPPFLHSIPIFFMPEFIFQMIQDLSQKSLWTFKGITPKGDELYIIWFIEALILIFITAAASQAMQDSLLRCDRCNNLVREEREFFLQPIENPESFISQAETGHFSTLKKTENNSDICNESKVTLKSCKCLEKNYLLDVEIMEQHPQTLKNQPRDILKNLYISQENFNKIKALDNDLVS